ncbi:MAG: hypothetical protein ACPF9K_15045 [Neptuniibacter sp.]
MKQNYLNTPRPLKEQVAVKVETDQLNETELNKLLELQADILQGEQSVQPEQLVSRHRSLVASVIMLVMLTVFFWQGAGTNSFEEIVDEVAVNHIKQRPMELHARSMTQIQSFFKELEFSPANSEHLLSHFNLAESDLIGARYCSIQGETAAQLRYQTSKGNHSTLYEVGYDQKLYGDLPMISEGERPQTVMVKGLKVSVWVEKGLLMALVEDM